MESRVTRGTFSASPSSFFFLPIFETAEAVGDETEERLGWLVADGYDHCLLDDAGGVVSDERGARWGTPWVTQERTWWENRRG